MHYVTKEIFVSQDSETVRKIGATSVVLNLGGGTESHEFHTCIHRTLRRWKNKMYVVNFIFSTFIAQNLFPPNPWGSIEPRLRITVLDEYRKEA